MILIAQHDMQSSLQHLHAHETQACHACMPDERCSHALHVQLARMTSLLVIMSCCTGTSVGLAMPVVALPLLQATLGPLGLHVAVIFAIVSSFAGTNCGMHCMQDISDACAQPKVCSDYMLLF